MFQTLGNLPIGWLLLALLAVAGFLAYFMGKTRVAALASSSKQIRLQHSQPNYHGYFVAISTVLPAALIFIFYLIFADAIVRHQVLSELPSYMQVRSPQELALYIDRIASHAALRSPDATGNILFDAASTRYAELKGMLRLVAIFAGAAAGAIGYFVSSRKVSLTLRSRTFVERSVHALLFLCAAVAVFTTVGIVISLVFETINFFSKDGAPSLIGFFFGTDWNAQTGTRFGALPLFFGTLMIALLAMVVAAPIGLFSAIYLSEYASPRLRATVKPMLELLAGIPTVVYGFFAATLVAPLVRSAAQWVNALSFTPDNLLAAQPTSALAAGLVMGIMIIPFVSSLSDDVINAVPQPLRDGALAMGATKSEMVKQIVLPAALPGIIAALLLAVSRAIGETMIVVMAAGGRALITVDPTSDITTVTYQIVSLLTGDTAFDSAKTLSAFALGFALFGVTLLFNLIALRVVQKYREKYD
jgi:phosphate transport system permease protein